MSTIRRVIPFSGLGRGDVGLVGGKNASLGEMIVNLGPAGVRVPDGFASTADAYREFLDAGGLRQRIVDQIDLLNGGAPLDDGGVSAARDDAAPLPADRLGGIARRRDRGRRGDRHGRGLRADHTCRA
nr:PEP/pyruvate-binding domain-containing protein [Streptomyces sp. TLI_235]